MLGKLSRLSDAGPLFLRITVGFAGIYHGHGMLFGGMRDFTAAVAALGLPGILAWAAALSEFVGGILLVLGLLTRWSALFFAITMSVAVVKVHWHEGYPKLEYPLLLGVAAVSLVFTGGGWLSFDRLVIRKES